MITFKPTLVEKIWGGTTLEQLTQGTASNTLYGEAWCLSPISPESTTTSGLSLTDALIEWNKQDPNIPTSFPLLIKILESTSPLSLQVHPSDEIAQRNNDGPVGKAEAWYILDCDDDTRIVLGIESGFEQSLRNNPDTILDHCRIVQAEPGLIIPIPPGTVHTVLGRMVWAEVQQASDLTYRLHDFGRGRELHLEKGLAAIDQNLQPEPTVIDWDSPWFRTETVTVRNMNIPAKSFEAWLYLDGDATIDGNKPRLGTTWLISPTERIECHGNADFLRIIPK